MLKLSVIPAVDGLIKPKSVILKVVPPLKPDVNKFSNTILSSPPTVSWDHVQVETNPGEEGSTHWQAKAEELKPTLEG